MDLTLASRLAGTIAAILCSYLRYWMVRYRWLYFSKNSESSSLVPALIFINKAR